MSENKKEKAPKAAATEATESVVETGPGAKDKRKKQAWSLERCLKFARRFSTDAEWQAGAPSSYKAAVAHNWHKQCVAAFRKPSANVGRTLPKSA